MTVGAAEAAVQAEQKGSTEQTSLNALQANIEEKREQSYYYAHRPRETSEEPAPLPVPVVLERAVVSEAGPTVVTVFNYAWADEGDVVKVYVPLEGVGSRCSDEDVKNTFEAHRFQLDVHGYKAGQVQRLLVPKLYGSVDPEGCRARKLANKVVVTLRKTASGKWYSLRGT